MNDEESKNKSEKTRTQNKEVEMLNKQTEN